MAETKAEEGRVVGMVVASGQILEGREAKMEEQGDAEVMKVGRTVGMKEAIMVGMMVESLVVGEEGAKARGEEVESEKVEEEANMEVVVDVEGVDVVMETRVD